MKNILILLMLFYCNSFELIGLKSFNNNFFNIISKTTAQSISREHQQQICNKLRSADFNNDGIIDGADYSILYLVAMKDQTTIESIRKNTDLYVLMDLSLDAINRSVASKKNNQSALSNINENDVAIFYNFLTDNIPYCPYKNSL
jgi:hypothetical protein